MSNPIETQARELIKSNMSQLKTVLGGDKQKISTYASALLEMATNPSLAGADVESIIKAGMQIVNAGLNPNPLFGQAYPVRYGRKIQLQIGYKGWVLLAYRAGWQVRAVPVYKCDEFEYQFGGLSDRITFKPNFDQREEDSGGWVHKNLRGVIVYAKDTKGNEFTEFVSFKKLEQLRMQSEFQDESFEEYKVSKNGKKFENIWYKWAEEMYKAKALKYIITRLPIDDKVQEVVALENKEDIKPIEQEQKKEEPLPAPTIDGLEQEEQTQEPMTSKEARALYNKAKAEGNAELATEYANLYKELKAKEVKNGNS